METAGIKDLKVITEEVDILLFKCFDENYPEIIKNLRKTESKGFLAVATEGPKIHTGFLETVRISGL